jgi:hypothetical protein
VWDLQEGGGIQIAEFAGHKYGISCVVSIHWLWLQYGRPGIESWWCTWGLSLGRYADDSCRIIRPCVHCGNWGSSRDWCLFNDAVSFSQYVASKWTGASPPRPHL